MQGSNLVLRRSVSEVSCGSRQPLIDGKVSPLPCFVTRVAKFGTMLANRKIGGLESEVFSHEHE
jgi:hypothetical protein